jgi:hypothetical protein
MFGASPLIDASRNALALRRKQFAADPAKVARAIVLRKIEASELPLKAIPIKEYDAALQQIVKMF